MWSDLPQLIKLCAALAFVVALMGGLAFILKRLGLSGPIVPAVKNRRLSVLESLPLDARRRLVLIKRDKKQHLVILGPNGETVLETGIESNEEHNDHA